MKTNMGNTDRAIRLIAATIIILAYVTGKIEGTMGIILLVLAGIFVLTSFIKFCPLYLPLGINTCKKKD